MSVRLLLMVCAVTSVIHAAALAATRLPGFRPSELSRLVIDPSDIRTLNASVVLESTALMRAHEAMNRYQDAVQDGSRAVLAAMEAMEPADAVAAARREQERAGMVENVRDRIEARRNAGEFRGDPGALREAWQEAMDEAERELARARRDTAEVDGWSEAFQGQARALAEWYDSKALLNASLHDELMEIAGESQEAELNRWWLASRLEHAMTRGRLSGERHDPFEVPFERSDASDLARDGWQLTHAELIDARDAALRRVPLVAADAIARGNLRRYRDAVAAAMFAREAVRDHAIVAAEMVAVLLADEAAARYLLASMKKSFPGVWRIDRAQRALDAASTSPTLDEPQRGMLAALRLEHQQLRDELRQRHVDAVRAEEGQQLADQDVQRASVLFGAGFTPRGTPMLDASASERRALSDDTLTRLRSILTDQQWQLIPGHRESPQRDQTPPS